MRAAEYGRGDKLRVAFADENGDLGEPRTMIVSTVTHIRTRKGHLKRVYLVSCDGAQLSESPVGEGEILGRADTW